MCIRAHIRVGECVYIYVYRYIQTYIDACVGLYAHLHVGIYIGVCVHIYRHTYGYVCFGFFSFTGPGPRIHCSGPDHLYVKIYIFI